MAKIQAGGVVYPSKKKLQEKCKSILNTPIKGEFLEGKDFSTIDDVLKMHHRYNTKVGKGGYKIGIRHCNVNFNNNQFFIRRQNGSETDFSYYKCLTHHSPVTELKKSLRSIIKYQMINYKTWYFDKEADSKGYLICPVTELKIKRKSSHLDHYPLQFEEIVEKWLIGNNLKVKDIKLLPAGDNETAWTLADTELANSFYDYHEDTAAYRIVLDKVNLQRGRAKVKLK